MQADAGLLVVHCPPVIVSDDELAVKRRPMHCQAIGPVCSMQGNVAMSVIHHAAYVPLDAG